MLDEKGQPQPVQRALIVPPRSRLGPITDAERRDVIRGSAIYGHYEQTLDRESAYELLKAAAEKAAAEHAAAEPAKRGRPPDDMMTAMFKSAVRSAGSQIGRSLIRGIMGSLAGRKR